MNKQSNQASASKGREFEPEIDDEDDELLDKIWAKVAKDHPPSEPEADEVPNDNGADPNSQNR